MRATREPRVVPSLVVGALSLGIGQQIFVAVRNPFLAELGVDAHLVPYVQGTGAAAGVVAGLVAARVAPRVRLRAPFIACALLQAIGFGVQALARGLPWFFVGAAIAGLAIQLHTAVAPPALRRATSVVERVRAFSRWTLALTPIAGVVGALLVQPIVRVIGRGVVADRAVLGLAAIASLLALVPFLRLGGDAPVVGVHASTVREPRRVALVVAFQAMIGLAGGIGVPFLPLHVHLAYGVSIDEIAALHGATMIAGVVAMSAAPALVRRLGHLRAVVALYALAVPLFLGLASTPRLPIALALYVARHAVVSLTAPIAQAFHQALVGEHDASAVAGYGTTASSFAWACGSFVAGPLVAAGGASFRGPLIATALAYALAATFASVVFPRLLARAEP